MNPSLKQQLQDWKQKHQEPTPKKVKKKKQQQKPQKAKSEHLSEREWKDIMGVNKRTLYRGKGGAWK